MSIIYHYIHNVCYWHGNDRAQNLLEHAKAIKSLEPSGIKNLFIVSHMVDNQDQIGDGLVHKVLEQRGSNLDVCIWPQYNSGGTVRSMWTVHKELQKHKISSKYFGTWEDDYIFSSNLFLNEVEIYLQRGYLFVGALWTEPLITQAGEFGYDGASGHSYDDMVKKGYKYLPPPGPNPNRHVPWLNCISPSIKEEDYRWCEDPYVMHFENLNKLESLIGEFTLANPNEKYEHALHGINHGEVGFPTRIHLAGGKFFGLKFNDHYQLLEGRSLIDHA